MKETVSKFQKCTSVLAVLFPLLYGVMYLPFWKGPKAFYQPYILLLSPWGIVGLLIQVCCLLVGIGRVYNAFYRQQKSETELSFALLIISGLVLMYMSFCFAEVIYGVIPF